MAVKTEVLTLDQTTRAARELITAAGGNGIHEDDLKAAIGELEDLAISAALCGKAGSPDSSRSAGIATARSCSGGTPMYDEVDAMPRRPRHRANEGAPAYGLVRVGTPAALDHCCLAAAAQDPDAGVKPA
jgi:hypothetical protein